MKLLTILAAGAAVAACSFTAYSAEKATVKLNLDKVNPEVTIPAEIYGQFAEHLGTCIYGGLWVGEESAIPNTNGYRNDVLQALKDLKVPVMRWPGGCFADEYHWVDGIGPKENRPVMINNNWGGTVEDNSFGTHEFFNLCELIGCEPYLSGNVGSGTVEELAKWVEYITAENGPMAEKRKANGREKPWKLKYLGVGNESWGCGGNFTPEDYASEYRRYQTYCRNIGDNKLYKIASGASDYDYAWTNTLMKKAGRMMNGLSLHYYTVKGWTGSKGSALNFDNDDYYWTLAKCLEIEPVIMKHDSIMNVYDPKKKVALLVDEWGTWWDEEPGTIPGHLYQQNTMRDAMVAALSLDVFNRHTDRVKMANIAQIANVLQSMVLTKDDKMVLTPTYYVFKMYAPHQNATFVPLEIETTVRELPGKQLGNRPLPTVSATASEKDGFLNITLTNVDLKEKAEITIPLEKIGKNAVTGEILTSAKPNDHNDFDTPDKVKTVPFKDFKVTKEGLKVTLPPMSIAALNVKI